MPAVAGGQGSAAIYATRHCSCCPDGGEPRHPELLELSELARFCVLCRVFGESAIRPFLAVGEAQVERQDSQNFREIA